MKQLFHILYIKDNVNLNSEPYGFLKSCTDKNISIKPS